MRIESVRPHTLMMVALLGAGLVCFFCVSPVAQAGTTWQGEAGTNWWFDPGNWSKGDDPGGPFLPPAQDNGAGTVVRTDAQINIGLTGVWNTSGEGVVYDPVNDPGYAAAAGYTYPTGSEVATYVGSDYGPEHIYRIYIGRNVTDGSTNLLTIKSGDLVIGNTTIIGRSGSTTGNENLGMVVQTGGRLRLPDHSLDIGQAEATGWGNGTYDYQGGTLNVALDAGSYGIRVAHGGGDAIAGGRGTFIVHNPTTGGHIRAWDYSSASWRGQPAVDGLSPGGLPYDPDGVVNGVATTEFHYENGGTRPIQLLENLSINNGFQIDTNGTVSSRLNLVLEEAACTGGSCVPNDIGLFDVDHGSVFGGIITGSGDDGGFFSSADGSTLYSEGSTVSAIFGATRYDWTISYTGDISWTDADNSEVLSVLGAGNGVDFVLIGLGSEVVGFPGDFDNDGDVDGGDFIVWQQGGSPSPLSASDLSVWQTNFPFPSSAVVAAVPEPSALVLLCLAGATLAMRRR